MQINTEQQSNYWLQPSPIDARSNSSTVSFAGTEQRNHDREEAMKRLGQVHKNDKKNRPLDVS